MKASTDWLESSGTDFIAGPGRRGYAHLKHYSAEYCEWGEGPPLVIVPGLAGGLDLLGPLVRLLQPHYQVISYQIRGEGDCCALRRRFELHDLVDDLREFLDWMGLESPPVLGVSFGGVLALELATRWPQRIHALALQGTGVRYEEQGLIQMIASLVLSRYPLPPDNAFVNQFFNLLFGSRQEPSPLFEFVTRCCWQSDQSVMAHRFELVRDFDIQARLKRIRVPTLIMTGDKDVLVSEQSRRELANGIRRARRKDLPCCGHLAFVSHPDLVASEVLRFLGQERP